MVGDNSGPSPGTIDALRRQVNPETGRFFTFADIARMFGVSRQAVHAMWRRNDGEKTPRQLAKEIYPWPGIRSEFQDSYLHKRLHDHAEYMMTRRGEGMQDYKLRELAWFYDHLDRNNLVVEFDPNITPSEEYSVGGYVYRDRRAADEDLIIRLNQYATLSEEDKPFWRFPEQRPEINP